MRSSVLTVVSAALALAVCFGAGCQQKKAWVAPGQTRIQDEAIALSNARETARAAQRLELAGRLDEAADRYLEAVNTYREMPEVWNNLGLLKMKQQENRQAAEAFQIAAELSPRDPKPAYNLGTLWESLLWHDDAARWYEEALKRDPYYQPALRRSVVTDKERLRYSDDTLDRIRRALLQETDPAWKTLLLREQIVARQHIETAAAERIDRE